MVKHQRRRERSHRSSPPTTPLSNPGHGSVNNHLAAEGVFAAAAASLGANLKMMFNPSGATAEGAASHYLCSLAFPTQPSRGREEFTDDDFWRKK